MKETLSINDHGREASPAHNRKACCYRNVDPRADKDNYLALGGEYSSRSVLEWKANGTEPFQCQY